MKSWVSFICMFWGLVLVSIVLVNCLDWDVYSKEKCFVFKRFFTTRQICNEGFTIRYIPIISLFFNLYIIRFRKGENYMFKHLPTKFHFFAPRSIKEKVIHDSFWKSIEKA